MIEGPRSSSATKGERTYDKVEKQTEEKHPKHKLEEFAYTAPTRGSLFFRGRDVFAPVRRFGTGIRGRPCHRQCAVRVRVKGELGIIRVG
jgi:hypothetical protein